MDYLNRQKRISDQIHSLRLAFLTVTHLPNIRYLCGFTGSAGVLLLNDRKRIFFTDGRYTEQAREEVQGARLVITKRAALSECANWILKQNARGRVGIEADHMTVAQKSGFSRLLKGKVRLAEVSGMVEQQRMVKEAEEIEKIRAAVKLGSSLFDTAVSAIAPGVRETDVAAELEYAARRAGADAMSFETIVASGPRSALPHGRASSAQIPSRGFVVLDFGVILAGYCSDMTRTVHVGAPTAEARSMYNAVRDAQQASIEAVRAEVTTGEVDRAARSTLRRARLDRYFTHSTGHGVGLEIHEPPRVARNQAEQLKSDMVITIEPGVYIPGTGGVRIEDMVVVTPSGCDVLTPTPKDLMVL